MPAIHSNIEHGKIDTDKSGCGLRESIASILTGRKWMEHFSENRKSHLVCKYLCTNDQYYNMRIAVARKTGREKTNLKRSVQMTCGWCFWIRLKFSRGWFPIIKRMKRKKKKKIPPYPHNVSQYIKSALSRTMTCKKMSRSGGTEVQPKPAA